MLLGLLLFGCGGSGGDTEEQPLTISADLSSDVIRLGYSANLNWNAEPATSCSIGADSDLPATGSMMILGDQPGDYTINIICYQGSKSASETLEYRVKSTPIFHQFTLAVNGVPKALNQSVAVIAIGQDEPVVLAETPIGITIEFNGSDGDTVCRAGETLLDTDGEGRHYGQTMAAYFTEILSIRCALGGSTFFQRALDITASDEILVEYVRNRYIPSANDKDPADPYSGYRQKNYYASIYRFIENAEIYLNPERYGLETTDPLYLSAELFLLNGAEAFFSPCPNYDVYRSTVPKQCRSVERRDEYYRWRSANTSEIRTLHAKAEWRGAAGVAQAIKSILLRNSADFQGQCPISDDPADLLSASIQCRALNVRRLLYREIWHKWNNQSWLDSMAIPSEGAMTGTTVPHYISWVELIVDLFQSTADIPHIIDCSNCDTANAIQVSSRRDFLFGYFYANAGRIYMSCQHQDFPRSCDYGNDDLSSAAGIEIGHQDTTIHLLSDGESDTICNSSNTHCFSLYSLAATLNDVTWVDDIANDAVAIKFPKFDIFMDGYCRKIYAMPMEDLSNLCMENWVTESTGWRPHRSLLGWVNLGEYNRELMIKLRRTVDENNDGALTSEDARLRNFSVFLYRALAKNGGPGL